MVIFEDFSECEKVLLMLMLMLMLMIYNMWWMAVAKALCDLSMLTQVAIDESATHLIKASIIYSYLGSEKY